MTGLNILVWRLRASLRTHWPPTCVIGGRSRRAPPTPTRGPSHDDRLNPFHLQPPGTRASVTSAIFFKAAGVLVVIVAVLLKGTVKERNVVQLGVALRWGLKTENPAADRARPLTPALCLVKRYLLLSGGRRCLRLRPHPPATRPISHLEPMRRPAKLPVTHCCVRTVLLNVLPVWLSGWGTGTLASGT
ncbi:hypothetical protein AAFF_G00273140 [Aldrovandia affinis]|uniref:Uncharacterized protein n=1 Tax=Aldrovandia affinis TaxID=143900 RepID=A0AAD7WSB9_9TELE|nr:hypothetical protein AAFF_G00273140 [Aldrovandia affinis]